jgi:hypothetical protein
MHVEHVSSEQMIAWLHKALAEHPVLSKVMAIAS